jgi:hypothetical protein
MYINNNAFQRRMFMNYLSAENFKYVRRDLRGGIGVLYSVYVTKRDSENIKVQVQNCAG